MECETSLEKDSTEVKLFKMLFFHVDGSWREEGRDSCSTFVFGTNRKIVGKIIFKDKKLIHLGYRDGIDRLNEYIYEVNSIKEYFAAMIDIVLFEFGELELPIKEEFLEYLLENKKYPQHFFYL